MEFRVLGTLEATIEGAAAPLRGTMQRRLLAALLINANAVVSVDRLADILWGDQPPANAAATLHTYVSRLRSALEVSTHDNERHESMLATRAPGYVLRIDSDRLDAVRFEHLMRTAQRDRDAGEPDRALKSLDEALGLWRGNAYAEFADEEFARTEALRLEELRRVAVEDRIAARLDLGHHAEVVGELESAIVEDPLRERPRSQLMVALYRCGRQAEALRVYQDYRHALADQLGIDPSPALRRVEQSILDQSPELEWQAARARVPPPPPPAAPPRAVDAPPEAWASHPSVAPVEWTPASESADLVSRGEALDALRQALADALGGSPRVVLVTGDAGIGKSRLVSALVAEARRAGIRPFVGRCLEDSQVPLLGIASVLDALGIDLSAADNGNGDAKAPMADEQSARLGTIVESTRALMGSAADRPVLLVVEDLQWADAATVEFAGHIVATLAHEAAYRQLPIVFLATARPEGGSIAARRLLSRLGHEQLGRTVRLDPLDELGVFQMVMALTGTRPSAGLLRFVHEATAGNPLEVSTLVTRLGTTGALEVRDGAVEAAARSVVTVPVEADADIGARLAGLPDASRDLVSTLALLRDNQIETLRLASGLDRDEFDAALDAAIDARIVDEDGERVEFTSARIRRQRLHSISGRRRQRLHAAIAQRLVDAGPEVVPVTEIAEQLRESGPSADPALLAQHAGAAGDQAFAVRMWVEAVRYYEAALDTGHLDPVTRAEYETRAGVAAYRSIDPAAAAVHAERALELAREHDILQVWGEAALLQSRVPPAVTAGDVRALHDFLGQAGSCEPALRAQVHARLSELAFGSLRLGEARAEAEEARSIATELNDHAVLARVDFVEGLHRFGNLEFDAALALFLHCEEHAQLARDSLLESWGLGRQPFALLTDGRLDAAEATAARAVRHNRTHGLWGEYALVSALRTGIAVAQGRVGTAERRAVDAAAALARTQLSYAASVLWGAVATARALIGDFAGAAQAAEEWDSADPRTAALGRQLVSALGDEDGARGREGGFRPLSRPGGHADLLSVGVAAIDVELADARGAPDAASDALPILTSGYERGMRFSTGWILFVPRLAGVACLLLERYDDAETWLRRACADAEAIGAAGELARASYDLARTHHARDRVTAETDELLTSAIHEFARLGYRPLLSRARRLAGLPDDAGPGDSPSTRVILVTDLVDSTPLNRRVGDRRFVELLREHNQIVRSRLRQFDGVEFKHTGDGVGAWFLTARSAVQCALAIHDDIERFNATSPEPLQIRIGLSSGEVIANEGDLYGIAVIEAFRICDHATDGRVLVAPGVPALVRDAALAFRSVGDVTLKGFGEPTALYEVVRVRA